MLCLLSSMSCSTVQHNGKVSANMAAEMFEAVMVSRECFDSIGRVAGSAGIVKRPHA